MTEDVFCGVVVSGSKDEPCMLAFLSDSIEVYGASDDEDLVEAIAEKAPKVVAFDTPFERRSSKGFRGAEDDLVEEGKAFLPRSMLDNDRIERSIFLRESLQHRLAGTQFIECRPHLSAEALHIAGDKDLDMLGIDTEDIYSTQAFDAVLAAITAKFYANGSFEDKGFILPKEI